MFLKGLRGHNNEGEGFCIKGFAANTSKYPDEAESSCAMHPSSYNSGFTLPFYGVWGSNLLSKTQLLKLTQSSSRSLSTKNYHWRSVTAFTEVSFHP